MQKSAMCTKLNKQFASGFAVGSLFPFFCKMSFSLCGEKFFFARKAEKCRKSTRIRRGLRCCL